jgi:hypothetical protein
MREQLLLHHVLAAARGERRAPVLLLLRQFLPQPCHRPIEMMQIEPRNAGELHARLGSVVIQIKPHLGTSGTVGRHPSLKWSSPVPVELERAAPPQAVAADRSRRPSRFQPGRNCSNLHRCQFLPRQGGRR